MTIDKRPFGQTRDGKEVELYALKDSGYTVEIITYGAAIRSIHVPVAGGIRDVALGFDDIEGYEAHKSYQGAVIGRISNRVANARYKMNGITYELDVNDGPNCLHGGFIGLDKQVWSASEEPGALVLSWSKAQLQAQPQIVARVSGATPGAKVPHVASLMRATGLRRAVGSVLLKQAAPPP